MNTEEILALPARALQQSQRQFYFEQGYLALPGLFDAPALQPLRAALDDVVEQSRALTESSREISLENGHCAKHPRLRRVAYLDDFNDSCWALCTDSVITDIAVDLLGPNLRFREMFANFKWSQGGAGVNWHQDIAFYPHTNTNTCQFLLALEDVESAQGPLQVVPRSHRGPIYPHYDEHGEWIGAISDTDLPTAGIDDAVELPGPAGMLTVHHSCAVHGSTQNLSERGRPMLVITYSAADAIPYTAAPYPSSHYGQLLRGEQPRYAHHEQLLMPLPPDWSAGYTSIFDHQQEQTAGS